MLHSIQMLSKEQFPTLLHEIPQPPQTLNYRGTLPSPELKLLAVVGSRKYTSYGKQVASHLVSGLRSYPVGIVSGLALGIDSLAHQAALDNNLYTLAIPGGGLNDSVIYPATHKRLAYNILAAGGGLLSEFDPDFKATRWSFTQRNRLVCGMCHATLLIEAAEQSGTLITARLATDYNREVLVVPGSIFSKNSAGTHQFLKLGATPVTDATDILTALQIENTSPKTAPLVPKLTTHEAAVLKLLIEPVSRDELIRQIPLPTANAAALLMQMEIKDLIVEQDGRYRSKL